MPSNYDRARDDFYDHKRVMHGGSYDTRCETCKELWQEFKAASEDKASGRGRS